MGGHYGKDLFKQVTELIERVERLESENQKLRRENARLSSCVDSLQKENEKLRAQVVALKEENASLRAEADNLRQENQLLKDDNERMKRIMNNDSSNSSVPPSADSSQQRPRKAPNEYNGRQKTTRKKGAQPGHKGSGLSKADVVKKIQDGQFEHRVMDTGDTSRPYISADIVWI